MGKALQPPVVNENFQVAVDRRLIKGLHDSAAVCKNLIDPQRPCLLPEDLFYGPSLGCVTSQCVNLLLDCI